MNKEDYKKSKYRASLNEARHTLESLRQDPEGGQDVTLAEYVQQRWQLSMSDFYADLGIDPSIDTIQNLYTLPDQSVRFLYPEIMRDALRLGLRRAAMWPSLISAEQSVKVPTIHQPWINMSDATPKLVGEAETIGVGTVSFGKKQFDIYKLGKGIKISYEVANYVSMNVVSIFLQDMGVKLGHGIDALAINCLINGEQTDGSESAPVVGVGTSGTLAYRDILRVWIRMSRIGRIPGVMIGGETAALETLDLTEFKTRNTGTPDKRLNLRTPVPQETNYFIHGNVPANKQIILDPATTMIKYNAQPLLVESEKIISNQTEATYATLTTGFGIAFRDARIILDKSQAFSSAGFPSYMDVDALENVIID